jgi:aminomethyltransferase
MRSFGTDAGLVRTALYDWHVEKGGSMVPFAGYELPVLYDGLGVVKETLHTRDENGCSLFDVSHKRQIKRRGQDSARF